MFHGRISLNSMLLLLLVNFVSWFRLELRYIFLIENIKSSLTHLHGFQLLVLLPQFIEMTFFICTKRINLLHVKFRQASNPCKRVLEDAKLAYANKTKESITSQKSGPWDFWRIPNSVLNKGKSVMSPLFNSPEVLSSPSDKEKLFMQR